VHFVEKLPHPYGKSEQGVVFMAKNADEKKQNAKI